MRRILKPLGEIIMKRASNERPETAGKAGRRHLPRPLPNGSNGANGHVVGPPVRAGVPPEPPPPPPPGAEERDGAGRFVPGCKAGPGNPYARRCAELRRAFLDAATPERVRALADRLFEQAMSGDAVAAKLVLSYSVGRPAEVVNPDRLDLDEFRQLCESPNVQEYLQACNRIVPILAVVLAGKRLAVDEEGFLRLAKDRLAMLEKQLHGSRGGLDDVLLGDDLDDDLDKDDG